MNTERYRPALVSYGEDHRFESRLRYRIHRQKKMFMVYLSPSRQMQDSTAQQDKTETVHTAVSIFTAFRYNNCEEQTGSADRQPQLHFCYVFRLL